MLTPGSQTPPSWLSSIDLGLSQLRRGDWRPATRRPENATCAVQRTGFNYIGDFHTFLLGVKSLENHAFSIKQPLVYLRATAPAADPGKQEGLTSV